MRFLRRRRRQDTAVRRAPAYGTGSATAHHAAEVGTSVLLLGIETSCDDTATAVVRDGVRVLANVSTNQDEFHAKYGGIVPEIASRRHAALLSAAVEDALDRAGLALDAVDGIAVTCGPGLIGSLVVGVAAAKALAFAAAPAAVRGEPSARTSLRPVSRARRAAAVRVSRAARLGRALAARRSRVADGAAHRRENARRRRRRSVRQDGASARTSVPGRACTRSAGARRRPAGDRVSAPPSRSRDAGLELLRTEDVRALLPRKRRRQTRSSRRTWPPRFRRRWSMC